MHRARRAPRAHRRKADLTLRGVRQIAYHVAWASLVALIVLCVVWELWLAPARLGGSWLVLKALPLLVPLRGILHGRRYTYQWSSMLILVYFSEGVVRAWAEAPPARTFAMIELLLALAFFIAAIVFARASAPSRTH